MASRSRKRKPPVKSRISAHAEPNNDLGGGATLEEQSEEGFSTIFSFGLNLTEAVIIGAAIAASMPKRKRVPTSKSFVSSHDLSLGDEHDENNAGEAERGK